MLRGVRGTAFAASGAAGKSLPWSEAQVAGPGHDERAEPQYGCSCFLAEHFAVGPLPTYFAPSGQLYVPEPARRRPAVSFKVASVSKPKGNDILGANLELGGIPSVRCPPPQCVFPRETLALYIKPFGSVHYTITIESRYTEQTRSLLSPPSGLHLRPTRLPPVPATFCAATQNKRLQPRAEFRARTHQNTTPLHHVVIPKTFSTRSQT